MGLALVHDMLVKHRVVARKFVLPCFGRRNLGFGETAACDVLRELIEARHIGTDVLDDLIDPVLELQPDQHLLQIGMDRLALLLQGVHGGLHRTRHRIEFLHDILSRFL